MKTEVKANDRFWRRGNVLDIAILLLVLASVALIGYRYYQTNRPVDADELEEYQITFRAESVLPGVVDALRQGDKIYLPDGTPVGRMGYDREGQASCPVAVSEASALVRDADGNYVNATVTDGSYLDIRGVLFCDALTSEDGIVLLGGSHAVTPGQRMTVNTETVTLHLIVVEIVEN